MLAWAVTLLAGAALLAWLFGSAPTPPVQADRATATTGTIRPTEARASTPISGSPQPAATTSGADPFRQFLADHPQGTPVPAGSQPPADPFRQVAEEAARRHASAAVSPFGGTRP